MQNGYIERFNGPMRDERLSEPGELTDQTGLPVSAPIAVETLPAPPPA